ncbi:MAG TPA: ABC transporter ATP-binding protein [Phycisphaerae bacterium]|nr:ABC transporter ATP-binding protein [Phycisphaerae bacterium]
MFTCEKLSKRYGVITALNSLSLSVEAGIVGLLGPNGAGKSTLISILLGQTPATSGRASVCGLDVARRQRMIRQRVGFVPENDCLIPGMTGTGYVCYVGKLAGMSHSDAMQRTHEVLDYVELDEARYRPAEQYSTGMKQRLKLAQALVHDPDVLFLDEPTNGMDPQGRRSMLSLIADLGRAGISVLLSSHLLPDVERVCQRVIIMGGGEVLSSGDIEGMRRPRPTRYTVDFEGDGAEFCRRLSEQQVKIRTRGNGTTAVELPDIGEEGAILRAARETNTRLRGLHPERSSLEEAFMAAIERQQNR